MVAELEMRTGYLVLRHVAGHASLGADPAGSCHTLSSGFVSGLCQMAAKAFGVIKYGIASHLLMGVVASQTT